METTLFYIQHHQKKIMFLTIICLALSVGIWGWTAQQRAKDTIAQNEMFQAVYQFEAGAYDQALKGSDSYAGFLSIIDTYGRSKAANLAHFYAGVCYMHQSNYEQAIRHLEKFKGQDYVLQSRAWSLIGDALVEQKNYQQATSYYKKAAAHQSNEAFSPVYLIKAALAYEAQQDYSNAKACYQQVVTMYPKSSLCADAKKHISRLEAIK